MCVPTRHSDAKVKINLASSSCTPTIFQNSETDLYLLFEKGQHGYWKSGSRSVLWIHQSGIESFFFSNEEVFQKQILHIG